MSMQTAAFKKLIYHSTQFDQRDALLNSMHHHPDEVAEMLDVLQQLLPGHVRDNHITSAHFFGKLFDHLVNLSLPLYQDHVQVSFICHNQLASGIAPGRLHTLTHHKECVDEEVLVDTVVVKHPVVHPIVLRESWFLHPLPMLKPNPPDLCQVLEIHSI